MVRSAKDDFAGLETNKLARRGRLYALEIYSKLFPGCRVEWFEKKDGSAHILDQAFAVDAKIILPSGGFLTLQEKYRNNDYLVCQRLQVQPPYPDFTQEYMNGAGTRHESLGEWFKLAAQLYFYGWENSDQSGFEKWVLLDVAKYKMIVEAAGGLPAIGKWFPNRKHGSATFYAIPIIRLQSAFLADYKKPDIFTAFRPSMN